MRVSRFSARFSFLTAAALIVSLLVVSCGGGNATDPTTTTEAEVADTVSPTTTSAPVSTTTAPETTTEVVSDATDSFAGVVDIGGRGLYLRCAGSGSPTVIMEGGDEDTSHSYAFAGTSISAVTRTCVYDRANLGQSDPAEGPRGLSELVGISKLSSKRPRWKDRTCWWAPLGAVTSLLDMHSLTPTRWRAWSLLRLHHRS